MICSDLPSYFKIYVDGDSLFKVYLSWGFPGGKGLFRPGTRWPSKVLSDSKVCQLQLPLAIFGPKNLKLSKKKVNNTDLKQLLISKQ
jgi:hypothetical protein